MRVTNTKNRKPGAPGMLQFPFLRLPGLCVHPTNLLPARVVITSYNQHSKAPFEPNLLRSSNQKLTRPPTGAFVLIQSILRGFEAVKKPSEIISISA